MTIETKVKDLTVAKMLQRQGSATASTLVKLTEKPLKSVLSTLRILYGQSKIHVGGYEINRRGKSSKVWAWGDGDDVREPIMEGKQAFTPRPDMAAAWLRNPI
jgi:hypothetical protein